MTTEELLIEIAKSGKLGLLEYNDGDYENTGVGFYVDVCATKPCEDCDDGYVFSSEDSREYRCEECNGSGKRTDYDKTYRNFGLDVRAALEFIFTFTPATESE